MATYCRLGPFAGASGRKIAVSLSACLLAFIPVTRAYGGEAAKPETVYRRFGETSIAPNGGPTASLPMAGPAFTRVANGQVFLSIIPDSGAYKVINNPVHIATYRLLDTYPAGQDEFLNDVRVVETYGISEECTSIVKVFGKLSYRVDGGSLIDLLGTSGSRFDIAGLSQTQKCNYFRLAGRAWYPKTRSRAYVIVRGRTIIGVNVGMLVDVPKGCTRCSRGRTD